MNFKNILELDEKHPHGVKYSEDFASKYVKSFEKRFTEIEFSRQEVGVLHNSYEWGCQMYESVKNNWKERILQLLNQNGSIRYGVLAVNELRSNKNLVICLVSGITQLAMQDHVIDQELAFTVADTCIQLVEETKREEELLHMAYASLFKIADLIEEYRQMDYHYLVKRAKEYICQHFHEQIVISQMAQQFEVNVDYLSRVFCKAEGIGLKAFIQKERIERSKNLLIYSDRSIQEISNYMAFSSNSHFSLVFRKYTGKTPGEFRREHS